MCRLQIAYVFFSYKNPTIFASGNTLIEVLPVCIWQISHKRFQAFKLKMKFNEWIWIQHVYESWVLFVQIFIRFSIADFVRFVN